MKVHTEVQEVFSPVEIRINLENVNDLACWVDLISRPYEIAALDHAYSTEVDMEKFVDNLAPTSTFEKLHSLLKSHKGTSE